MNLPRVVDTDHDSSRMMRAALDCFAPLAITIRARPEPARMHGSAQVQANRARAS